MLHVPISICKYIDQQNMFHKDVKAMVKYLH